MEILFISSNDALYWLWNEKCSSDKRVKNWALIYYAEQPIRSKVVHCGESTVSPPTNHSGPSSNPRIDAMCGLSLFLVYSLAPRGFSPGTPVFPSPQKPMQLFQIPILSGTHGHVSTSSYKLLRSSCVYTYYNLPS